MLAKINWCFVFNMDEFDEKTDNLINLMKKDLVDHVTARDIYTTHGVSYSLNKETDEETDSRQSIDVSSLEGDTHFWDRHFKGQTEVSDCILRMLR